MFFQITLSFGAMVTIFTSKWFYSRMPTFVVFVQITLLFGAMVTIFTSKGSFTSVNSHMYYHIGLSPLNFLAKRTFIFWVSKPDGFSLQQMNKIFSDLKELSFLVRLITNCRPAGFFIKQGFSLTSDHL